MPRLSAEEVSAPERSKTKEQEPHGNAENVSLKEDQEAQAQELAVGELGDYITQPLLATGGSGGADLLLLLLPSVTIASPAPLALLAPSSDGGLMVKFLAPTNPAAAATQASRSGTDRTRLIPPAATKSQRGDADKESYSWRRDISRGNP